MSVHPRRSLLVACVSGVGAIKKSMYSCGVGYTINGNCVGNVICVYGDSM